MLVALPFFWAVILRRGVWADRNGSFRRALEWMWWMALGLEAVSGAAWFWLAGAQMNDQSAWSVPDLGTVLWQTSFGRLWLVRAGVGLALGGIFFWGRKAGLCPGRDWLLLAVGGCLLGSIAWAGHAEAGIHQRAFHLFVDALHLLLGAIWPMGLIPLGLFLRELRMRDPAGLLQGEERILRRFSQTSLVAVLLLVATGLINSWFMIGAWNELVTSVYGRLLLAKVILVLVMIGLGAVNRLYLLPRMASGPPGLWTLRGAIQAEICFALLVLLIVGVMGITPPPP